MAKQTSTRLRVARDRARAGFFAFLAALPAVAAIVGVIYLAGRLVLESKPEDYSEDGGYLVLGILALFGFLFVVVARWTYDAVQAALTPSRVQAMWLRRFQSESGDAFRTSRVIDRLARYGVSALTLQDRDVQLSFEQRRNRLAPIFWLLFIPITALVIYGATQGFEAAKADLLDMPSARTLEEGVGQIFQVFIGTIVVALVWILSMVFGVMLTILAVMGIAAISGPVGAMFSKGRDDYKSLPRRLQRISRGRRQGGATVVRIGDAHWREAVQSSLAAVDVSIIDLTSVSEHLLWEINEAVRAGGAPSLVFICRAGEDGATRLSPEAQQALRAALGREPGPAEVVFYPTHRKADAKKFAAELRDAIYVAADSRKATQGA